MAQTVAPYIRTGCHPVEKGKERILKQLIIKKEDENSQSWCKLATARCKL